MITVTRAFRFEASHSLPYYNGDCHNLHGHSYKLEVTVTGDVIQDIKNPKCGMIIDFKDLNSIVKSEIINKLDHHHLNDIVSNPTAENLAKYIGDHLVKVFIEFFGYDSHKMKILSIRLWETENSYAEYFPLDGGY